MHLKAKWVRSAAIFRHWLSPVTEPHILFPTIAILGLVAIWASTLQLVNSDRVAAEHAAVALTRDLGETYESQVLRAVREIDQTLKFVKYAYEQKNLQLELRELKEQDLLPPDLLFVVSIADSKGNIVSSTRPTLIRNVADQDYFQSQRQTDSFAVGRPQQTAGSSDWNLLFSHRLVAAGGSFAGIVMLSVDAAYFVSGYETSKLGQKGVLAMLGTDGIFRVSRTGDSVSAGIATPYADVVSAGNSPDGAGRPSNNAWDGVRRYTSAHELYDAPLAVVVGLSVDEQMAVPHQHMLDYLWRAVIGSIVLLLVTGVLGRMSGKLASNRKRTAAEHVAHAARIEYIAYHDGLTTLPNRRLFSQLLGKSINQATRYHRQLAVLFLDLDRFKHINDTLGHDAGDQLLQEVASRLKKCLRDSDTVARLGGDEFIVLLPELDAKTYAATVAQKILAGIARPFVLLGQEIRVTASVGISIGPQDGEDEQTLIKNADSAMYQAKAEGKNNFQFYSEKLNSNSLERLTLESSLRHALERNEFQLHYQAKRDTHSDRITGVEALLRWQHPDLGTVAPMQFIPVAEETGLIVAIGKWVLRTACLQNMRWQKQGLPPVSMAVNLTARQFSDEHLLPDLIAILGETGMDAHLLELEISESLLMGDMDKNLRILTGLKGMGIRIAIDDFGVGYSSLTSLKQFPLDTIKIDRSFIRNVTTTREDRDLTEAIIALGRALTLTVVAQGVETQEQADYLRENACDEFQGFYLNKPLPANQVADLLQTQLTRDAAPATNRVG